MSFRLIALVSLFAIACGQAADGSSHMDDGDDSSSQDLGDETVSAVSARPVTTSEPRPLAHANVEQPAPVVTPAPVVSPVVEQPAPAPTPEPVVEQPAPVVTPEPAPTPANPLRLDCTDAESCAACTETLAPEWVDSGAASCELRECAADAECDDLGDSLVCRPYLNPGDRPVCRAARLAANADCPVNELISEQPLSPCEPGLVCRPYAGELRCRPL